MAGLLTRPGHRAFPVLHQWQKFDVRFVDSQQRVLSRIFTGFPFHSEGVNLPKPFPDCKIIYITYQFQIIHNIYNKHTKHDNRTVLIRAFKFTTNEDGNYHTQYP